jgi:hypothetical protein
LRRRGVNIRRFTHLPTAKNKVRLDNEMTYPVTSYLRALGVVHSEDIASQELPAVGRLQNVFRSAFVRSLLDGAIRGYSKRVTSAKGL